MSDVQIAVQRTEPIPPPKRRPVWVRFGKAFMEMGWGVKLATIWLILICFGAIFADFLPLKDPNYQGFIYGLATTNENPSWTYLFGTDDLSRDIFARIIYGARVSLVVALSAVTFGIVIGGFFGSLVGFVRGRLDNVVMGAVDVILAFPGLVLLLALVTFLQTRNLLVISLVIGLLSIPPYTRVARANSLSISRREFVTAAEAIGTKRFTILRREIIPNVLPSLFAYAMVAAAFIIVLEGSLAFLGLSVQPPTATWGAMINQSRKDIRLVLHPVLFPSAAMVFTVLSLNTVGDWLRARSSVRGSSL
jgi:peptide/nickel transport system permease protein